MTIIEEFTKDMTENEIQNWMDRCATRASEYQDIVRHFEAKIEGLQAQINNLTAAKPSEGVTCSPIPQEGFKIGYVYKNKEGEDVLIWNIKILSLYALQGGNLTTDNVQTFTAEGIFEVNEDDPKNLILSSGKKWEIPD